MKKLLLTLSAVAAVATYGHAQTDVSTNGVKHVLLEEGTGEWCGYCPDGAQNLEQTVEPAHPNLIVASFHNGDPLALTPDDFNTAYIQYYGWPGASVDRKIYHAAAWDTLVAEDRGLWTYNVATEEATTPKFDVSMHITCDSTNATHDTVTIKVTAKALVAQTGTFYLNCYIIEDSISSAAPNQQDSYMNAAGSTCVNGQPSWFIGLGDPITPASKYWHQHVVRAVLANGASIWGDAGVIATNPTVNSTASKTYTYVIPSGQRAHFLRVIGLVQQWDATNSNNRPVMNAVQAKLPKANLPNSVAIVNSNLEEINIYPNPASSVINIQGKLKVAADVQVTITNTLGQVVAKTNYDNTGTEFSHAIPVSALSNGLYMVTINAGGVSHVEKIIVNK